MRAWVILAATSFIGCDPDDAPRSLLPADWETSLVSLRGCRQGPEHDLEYVRLLADPGSAADYDRCAVPDGTCTTPFAEGALFVKPQYADAGCTELVRFSLAKKDGDFAASGGWRWQELDAAGEVKLDGALQRCAHCHASCEGSFDSRCYMVR